MFALIIYFIHIFRYFCSMWTSWMSFLFSGWVLAIFHLLSPIIFFHHLNKLSLYSVPAFSVILSDTNIFIFVSCGLCCFVLLCVTLLCFGVLCCVVLCGMSCAEECVVFSYVVCCLCSVVLYCGCLRLSYHIISYHVISYYRHIISYHIMSYHITSYHVILYHIISYHIISYYIISYHIISLYVISNL